MIRWLSLTPIVAALSGIACDSGGDHGAHEVPVSKPATVDGAKTGPELGETQKIPLH